MIGLDGNFILEVAPRFSGSKAAAQSAIVGAISGEFESILAEYDIDEYLRIAHFMGQVTHECAGFRTTEEFASGAAYEGRTDLGNVNPGDGRRYKGRGLLQLTGRANYRRYGDLMGLPLEAEPQRAGEPLTSLRIACEYWKDRRINPDCDRDDLVAVTKKVNGGTNGIDDRRKYLQKAKAALKLRMGTVIASQSGDSRPVLRRGSFGEAVARLQEALRGHGFAISIDFDFGGATELAVLEFQKRKGLEEDGIVGKDTWDALGGAEQGP
ncbi:MAG: peptidoglycan-binding protein [Rhodobacter sp.]|nr:peptidoglycan-binding protein [Rhodobacter sp.]